MSAFRTLEAADLEGESDGWTVPEVAAPPPPTGLGSLRCLVFSLGAIAGATAVVATAASAFDASLRLRSREASSDGVASVSLDAVEGVAPPPACVGENQNCLSSKCCWDGGEKGFQCYAKDDFWASCLPDCAPGVHPGEKHGTYDASGQFHLDAWRCTALGNRSSPACQNYEAADCPSDRCMMKGSCLPACSIFGDEPGCASQEKCMWKGKCMEACGTFASAETCQPTDKCIWKNDKCEAGCWTFGPDTCSKHDRCVMVGQECKDNCWTYSSEGDCGGQDRCTWRDDKCQQSCSTYSTKQSCPAAIGCIWDAPEPNGPVKCMADPCAAPGEDCTKSKCCSAQRGGAGQVCFAKTENYATCKPWCDPKQTPDWSCQALSNRSMFESGCGWAGESCVKDEVCCNIGFSCVVKDDFFTGCVQTKKKSTWVSMDVPLPAGWKGNFIGGGRTEYAVPPAGPNEAVADASLYCFMAILPDSPEVNLMKLAKQNKASIFACDASDVFHSWKSAMNGWDTGEATLTNTDVFINVWDQVLNAGRYVNFEWTAKVDADAVLVPARLKQHIYALRPPANRAIYLKNNAMDPGLGNNGFLGAVEVFSRVAMYVYFDNKEGCRKTLGIQAGEDGYFKGCMDALGVGYMVDQNLFNPDSSAGACIMGERAAYHPLKNPVDWQCCVDIISGHPHNVEYGHCNLGYDLKITG